MSTMNLARREGSLLGDSMTMFGRSLKLSMRSPEAIFMALIVPAVLMVVFVYVFGGAMDVGGYSVVNFIVPGIILQTIGQGMPAIAVRVNSDMTKGIVDRFRTMPIAKSSILVGHAFATLVQSAITVAATIGAALLVGFRPSAGLIEWLMIAGILVLYIFMMAWLAVVSGVHAKESESAAGLMSMIGILPFLSSGFVPTETMPWALRVFAENQPMTPIINTMRALMLDQPLPDGALRAAILWCVGLTVVFYGMALAIYQRKTRR
ncbi:MAG: ABC transporter permease [Oscillospiraceae bacterium]|nr:ABC transporter permease [Oscillospiraceae bacterium]